MSIDKSAEQMREELDKQSKTMVSVALFGQPGAGKSSLINALVGKKVAQEGVETDTTVRAASYEHNGLKLVDLPGYGTKNFPRETYFKNFDVEEFDLFLCVVNGKLHEADTDFFQQLSERGKVCIFVVNMHDKLWEDGVSIEELEKRKVADIEKHVLKKVKIIFTSCRAKTGLNELNNEILNNLDQAKSERWVRGAKAYSEEFLAAKKAACEKTVALAAGSSAANGINPVPGVDVAVDLGILVAMFTKIRDYYGLEESSVKSLKDSSVPAVIVSLDVV